MSIVVAGRHSESDCHRSSFADIAMVGHGSHFHHASNSIADGCKHVFLDVGSNMGVQIRKLFEPELYTRKSMSSIMKVFPQYFGKDNVTWKKDVCAIGFEPNPAHIPRLKQLARRYTARGWRTTFIFAAVSDHSSVSSYKSPNQGTLQAAGRLKTDKKCTKGSDTLHVGKVDVHVINFAEFLLNHIKYRKLPPAGYDTNKGNVLAKLDIEGAEYDVTKQLVLVNDGIEKLKCHDKDTVVKCNQRNHTLIDIIDHYLIEWHEEEELKHLKLFEQWNTSVFQDKWDQLDDESYKFDPYPLPEKLGNATMHKSLSDVTEDPWSVLNVQEHGAFWRSSNFSSSSSSRDDDDT
jgi:hypothetical protein